MVILADGHGRFQPVEVTPGAEADGRSEILSGLAEGDRVVASGQFLIDSEAGLQGVLTRLAAGGPVRAETKARRRACAGERTRRGGSGQPR
jgi:Cu(I)/Ag(I) efflux system membrane fusion protein